MELHWFLEFIVLSETLHYANAADKLYTTQSTLSKHIQSMEKELGSPLFTRSYHKLELTPFGRMMLPYAYDIMRVKGSYEEAAYRMLHSEAKVLRINAIPALPEYGITEKFLKFQQKYPNVQIAVSEADSIIIRKELLEHQCDLAIMRTSREVTDASSVSFSEDMLRKIPFCRDELVAVLPLSHPLAHERQLNLRQLTNDHFVLIKEGSLPYLLNILNQNAYIIIATYGIALIMMSGGLDMSVGYMMSICGVMAAMMILAGVPVFIACVITILAGILFGALGTLLEQLLQLPRIFVSIGLSTVY